MILFVGIFLMSLSVFGQNTNYTYETFETSEGAVMNYRMLSPLNQKKGEKYPLVLFLHGAGERGSDNERQLVHGASLFEMEKNRENYPAFVLFPQCSDQYFWAFDPVPPHYINEEFPEDYPAAPGISQVKELLDSYLLLEEVDKERIYILGISMGGMGTFDMVCRYPELFAAAIPICGGVNTKRLTEDLKDVYWRIYHGEIDDVVPVKNSREAYLSLQEIGADVEYTEYPGVTHGSWMNAFNEGDFLSWLFSKRRK